MPLPLDYDLIRIALVAALRLATGLDQNHVIMAEPESPNWPRPSLPYFSIKVTVAASRFGDDVQDQVGETNTGYTFNSGGPRGMTVRFVCYAPSHEVASSLMALWQAYLDTDDVQALLRAAGIAVWKIGEVDDESMLLNAGFEGRAAMLVTCGLASNLEIAVQIIEQATVTGNIDTTADIITTSDTVTSEVS